MNLYHYKARFYSPAIGRFLQTDPIGYRDDLNLYAYVGNDPLNLRDPTGNAKRALDGLQTGLDIFGLVPGVGEFAVIANAGIYGLRGDYVNMGLSGSSAIPFVGWGATVGKFANKLDGVVDASRYTPSSPPVRIEGDWSINDMKQGLLGHPPRGLGSPDLHHADQMPGSGVHEILPAQHRGNVELHPNRYNQGVTPEMRDADRQLHWWYRAREQGADEVLPDWIYD